VLQNPHFRVGRQQVWINQMARWYLKRRLVAVGLLALHLLPVWRLVGLHSQQGLRLVLRLAAAAGINPYR
jgi:hypothetical protein